MRPGALLTALAAGAVSVWPAARVEAQAAALDTVTLSFDWPVGMVADVQGRRSRVQRSDSGGDSTSTDFTYELRVVQHDRGQLIEYSRFTILGVGSANPLGVEARTRQYRFSYP